MKKPDPELIDEDNPELTADDFARARPARELYPDLANQSGPRKRGRHKIVLSPGADREIVVRHAGVVTVAKGLDGRTRDRSGEVRRQNGDTLVGTLRQVYGEEFGREVRSDAKLETLLERTDSESLSDYLKKQGQAPKIGRASRK